MVNLVEMALVIIQKKRVDIFKFFGKSRLYAAEPFFESFERVHSMF